MKVRTIRDHDNSHGHTYHKKAKDKTGYVIADETAAARLIEEGFVEKVEDEPKSAAKSKATAASTAE